VRSLGPSWEFEAARPQTLWPEIAEAGVQRNFWTVDARKLTSNDKQAKSPEFNISSGDGNVKLRMMIFPTVVSEGKGGGSFRKAKGRGKLELKCESDTRKLEYGRVKFRLYIGSGHSWQLPRGPVEADFVTKGSWGLPQGEEEWNFTEVVEKISQTFEVCLEVLS